MNKKDNILKILSIIYVITSLFSLNFAQVDNKNIKTPLVFFDDFSSEKLNPAWKIKGGKWKIINGELHLVQLDSGGGTRENDLKYLNYIYIENAGSDIRLSAKMTLLEAKNDMWSATGIFVHGKPTGVEQYKRWVMGVRFKKEKNKYHISLLDEWGTPGWLIEEGQMNAEYRMFISTGITYCIKMEVVGREVWGKFWEADKEEPENWTVAGIFPEDGLGNTAAGLFSDDFRVKYDDVKIEILPPGYSHKDKKLQRTVSDYIASSGFSMNNLVIGTISTYFSDLTLNSTLIGFEYKQNPRNRKKIIFRFINGVTPSWLNTFVSKDIKFKPKTASGIKITKPLKGNSSFSFSSVAISNSNYLENIRNNLIAGGEFFLEPAKGVDFSGEISLNKTNYDIEKSSSFSTAIKTGGRYRFKNTTLNLNYSRVSPNFTLLVSSIPADREIQSLNWYQRITKSFTQNFVLDVQRNNLEKQSISTTKIISPGIEWYWQTTNIIGLDLILRNEKIQTSDYSFNQFKNTVFPRIFFKIRTLEMIIGGQSGYLSSNVDVKHNIYSYTSTVRYNFTPFSFPTFLEFENFKSFDYLQNGSKSGITEDIKLIVKTKPNKYFLFDFSFKFHSYDSRINESDDEKTAEYKLKIEYMIPLKKDINLAGNVEL